MIALTATTGNQSPLVDIQREAALLCGLAENQHLCLEIPKDYPRHPSWFKIQAILRHLPNHDYIWWMDTDSMFLRHTGWVHLAAQLGSNPFTAALARDYNGFNCGVMIWRRCPEAFDFLWRIYDSYEKFAQHPWFEQGAFHTMAESQKVLELPKSVYNAYESDRAVDSMILHLPGKSHEHRLRVMGAELEKLKARPQP